MAGDQNWLATTWHAQWHSFPLPLESPKETVQAQVFQAWKPAGTETLSQYPNVPARILAIMDDFHLIAVLNHLGPIFTTLLAILLSCVGVQIYLSKSSLNVLQAATIVNPKTRMRLVSEQSPILAELPLVTVSLTDSSVWAHQ
jgi:hypothetical protein